MTMRAKTWLIGTTLLAAAMRFQALFANRFHADEALFASWARLIAVGRDLLLQSQPVDKPPLLFYMQALIYPLMGPVEWAARLPGLAASLLLVPLVAVLAWHLSGSELAAILSAALVALSPLAIQFSSTAFTDPLLTLLLVSSLYSGCSSLTQSPTEVDSKSMRYSVSGLLFGLATATKHQAWLFLPLFLATGLIVGWRGIQWRQWLTGLLVIVMPVLGWEWIRTGTLSLWSNQITNFGGIRPIYSWELWPRLLDWLSLWQYVLAIPLFFLTIPVLLLPRRRSGKGRSLVWLWLLFLFAYVWLHWILAIPVWDRYLLPAVPLVAILVSIALSCLLCSKWFRLRFRHGGQAMHVSSSSNRPGMLALALLLVLQLPAALAAREGRFPIGGLPTADHGAAAVAEHLAKAPYGTVLYDHWYSWHWRYQLFDKRVFIQWFPHSEALVEDLRAFGQDGNPRYLALPTSEVSRPVERAVAAAGFQLQDVPVAGSSQIALFQILPTDVAR